MREDRAVVKEADEEQEAKQKRDDENSIMKCATVQILIGQI